MTSLTIDNSTSTIEGLSPYQEQRLRSVLSYTERSFHGPRRRCLLGKRGGFPSGLLYLVERFLKKRGIQHRRIDLRQAPRARHGLFTLSLGYEPYPEQLEAAQACSERGIVCAPTGVGKSAIAALIVNRLQVRTLIVVPSLELKRQLTGTLRQAFGADMVGGLGKPLAVENVDALDPATPCGYDCVIIDEFHHAAAATYRRLNKRSWAGVYYRFGLTATPWRSQDHERLLLESLLSRVIYRIEYTTAVEKGYIVPVEAYYVDLPVQDYRGEETWAAVYSALVVNNEYRNARIIELIESLREAGAPTLTLVKEIGHGEALAKATGVGFANGQDGNSRERILEFILGYTKSLIGTTGVVGEGIDTKPAEYAILAAGGKSKNAFMQQVGRVLRLLPGKESGKVILFRDKSHRWLMQHFRAQCKVLRDEYGVVPIKLAA